MVVAGLAVKVEVAVMVALVVLQDRLIRVVREVTTVEVVVAAVPTLLLVMVQVEMEVFV
jgi:hypothetical protein